MTDSLLVLCLGLTTIAGGLKYRMRRSISELRMEIAELRAARSKIWFQRKQAENELAQTELKERELTSDCRDLSEELLEKQTKIEKFGVAETQARKNDALECHDESETWFTRKHQSARLGLAKLP